MSLTEARFRSMRAHMTTHFGAFVAVLMLAGGTVMHHREERRAEKRSKEILEVAVQRAKVEMEEADEHGLSLLQIARAETNEIAAGGLVLVVADPNKILWRSHRVAPPWPAVGEDWRIHTLSHKGQTLILAQDWKPIARDLDEAAWALWALGLLVVAGTTLGAWFVVGNTLFPLNELASQAQNASAEGLQVRLISPSSDAEMEHLTETLNDLLCRLEKEAQARGRFYAAASHELRTPLQALLGQIEVALSRPRSSASHEEILERLQRQTERLGTLVQDLLQLNVLEMRQDQAPPEKLNLAFWVQRALDQQEEEIALRFLSIKTDMDEIEIEAPSGHIEILLRNLVENAVKYATPNSEIMVEVKAGDDSSCLAIWNAFHLQVDVGMEHWFEPFFRHDVSRNSKTGGNGLGLSIVSALAHTNRWKVSLRPLNGGVEACVQFPLQ